MSTRANIVVKDRNEELWFYRHSDGYPEGTMPMLNVLLKWLRDGVIRGNVGQAAGWLIVLGAIECASIPNYAIKKMKYYKYGDLSSVKDPETWKVGSVEPTTGIHGDIEFLYVVDLDEKTVVCYDSWSDAGVGLNEVDLSDL